MAFSPFRAVRFNDPSSDVDDGVLELDSVIAPSQCIFDASLRAEYALRSSKNVVHLLAGGAEDPWDAWLSSGHLVIDAAPSFYVYRIGLRNAEGTSFQRTGVVGVIDDGPASDDSDHPDLRIETDVSDVDTTNQSVHAHSNQRVAIDCVEIDAPGFSELLNPTGMPLARSSDDSGAHHRLWAMTQSGVANIITDAFAQHGGSPNAGFAPTGEHAALTGDHVDPGFGRGRMVFLTERVSFGSLPILPTPALGMLMLG